MLKLRLRRIGRKRRPAYRLVIMENSTRRDGRFIDQVGYYDVLTKKLMINKFKVDKWIKVGVRPTATVLALLKKGEIRAI